MSQYAHAGPVQEVAEGLIDEIHTHLANERIDYVFTDDVTEKGGREVWGQARKLSGLNAYLSQRDVPKSLRSDAFFVIEVSKPVWESLREEQRIALVDHELSHCRIEYTKEGRKKLVIVEHDLEEFRAVYERHGAWSDNVKAFLAARAETQLRFAVDVTDLSEIDDREEEDEEAVA